jgi:hypothetical protein
MQIACGKCTSCQLKRQREWAIRCEHELQEPWGDLEPGVGCFITLTYDDEHLPEDGLLDTQHWSLFAKRVRKRFGKFRFFGCGEYGSLGRCHWHAAVFGIDWRETTRGGEKWTTTEDGNDLYVNTSLSSTWKFGFVTVGELTFDSAAYVAKYCQKSQSTSVTNSSSGQMPSSSPDGGPSGLGIMSRNPGIGRAYFDRWRSEMYAHDAVMAKGKPFPVPSRYDDWLKKDCATEWNRVKERRILKALKRQRRSNEDRERYEIARDTEKVQNVRRGHYDVRGINRGL